MEIPVGCFRAPSWNSAHNLDQSLQTPISQSLEFWLVSLALLVDTSKWKSMDTYTICELQGSSIFLWDKFWVCSHSWLPNLGLRFPGGHVKYLLSFISIKDFWGDMKIQLIVLRTYSLLCAQESCLLVLMEPDAFHGIQTGSRSMEW